MTCSYSLPGCEVIRIVSLCIEEQGVSRVENKNDVTPRIARILQDSACWWLELLKTKYDTKKSNLFSGVLFM